MKLTIIVPVFNEEKTVNKVIQALDNLVLSNIEKEIIVVDDGSTDASASEIKMSKSKIQNLKIISHKKNYGKGKAVKTGIKHATGDYIIVQDADLEYNPKQIAKLVKLVLGNKEAVVYGTRLNRPPNIKNEERTARFMLHYTGNRLLSLLTSLLFGQWITDMETCYKLFPKNALDGVTLNARGFEFEPEITAKLLKKGYKIVEVPITTTPRTYKQGKKLHTVRDGVKALWALLYYRFRN